MNDLTMKLLGNAAFFAPFAIAATILIFWALANMPSSFFDGVENVLRLTSAAIKHAPTRFILLVGGMLAIMIVVYLLTKAVLFSVVAGVLIPAIVFVWDFVENAS